MPISFQCDCGRKVMTADENAGRNAICPQCGVQVMVPASDAVQPRRSGLPPIPDNEDNGGAYNLASEEVVPTARRGTPAAYDRPRPGDRDDDYPQTRHGRDPYDDANRFVKPAPTTKRGWTEAGVMAGVGMMVGGVLITVVGLALGWIIYYGPILFVIGVVSCIKGVASKKM